MFVKDRINSDKIFNVKNEIVQWVRDYMARNGKPDTPIIIGISGGKDSSIVATLCVEAVGKDRVIGVLLPDGEQKDIDVSRSLVTYLGIKSYEFDISKVMDIMANQTRQVDSYHNEVYKFNTPARIRMAYLYGIANMLGGRVANTCNFTESYLGYDTKFGDQCGDFSPLKEILCTDVIKIGEACRLPDKFVHKPPDDGMCGMTDEERFGFSYATADRYLSGGCVTSDITDKIVKMHNSAVHKDCIFIPCYQPNYIYYGDN